MMLKLPKKGRNFKIISDWFVDRIENGVIFTKYVDADGDAPTPAKEYYNRILYKLWSDIK